MNLIPSQNLRGHNRFNKVQGVPTSRQCADSSKSCHLHHVAAYVNSLFGLMSFGPQGHFSRGNSACKVKHEIFATLLPEAIQAPRKCTKPPSTPVEDGIGVTARMDIKSKSFNGSTFSLSSANKHPNHRCIHDRVGDATTWYMCLGYLVTDRHWTSYQLLEILRNHSCSAFVLATPCRMPANCLVQQHHTAVNYINR